jgi:hypothetical protein
MKKDTGKRSAMKGSISPSGDKHPGEIHYEDTVDRRKWSEKASAVPRSIAWVNVEGVWRPVVNIKITGTAGHRHIAKFGPDGDLLDITLQ